MAQLIELVKALAWPVILLVIVCMFRPHIIALLRRIKKADFPGGVSVETFPEELKSAKILSAQVQEEEDEKREAREAEQDTGTETRKSSASIPLTEVNARMLNLGMSPSPTGLELSSYAIVAEKDPNLALAGIRMEVELMLRNLATGWNLDSTPRDSAGVLVRKLKDHGAITTRQAELLTTVLRLCNSAVHGVRVTEADVDEILNTLVILRDQYVAWLGWGFPDRWKPKDK